MGLWFKAAVLCLYAAAIVAVLVLWYVWAWSFSVHTLLFVMFVQAGLGASARSAKANREAKKSPLLYAAKAQQRFGKDQ